MSTTPISKEPAAPQKPAAMTPEERKRRYHEYLKRTGRSRLEVKGGDPNLHYFWAPKNDDAEMVRLDYLGYQIVRLANAKDVMAGKGEATHNSYPINAVGLKEDGTFSIGDVILVACPAETYEFHMLDVEERSEAQIAASVEEFKSTARQRGVPTFDVPVKG